VIARYRTVLDLRVQEWPCSWARIGKGVVVTQIAGADDPVPPGRSGAGGGSFAVLTVDAAGLVTTWSVAAARLFGRTAAEMTGQHLGDVLLNRPGQRELLGQALAEVGAGRPWTATVDLAFARADGLATMHCGGPGFEPDDIALAGELAGRRWSSGMRWVMARRRRRSWCNCAPPPPP
jgi:PAS domain-containing protein